MILKNFGLGALLIVIMGISISVIVFFQVKRWEEVRIKNAFDISAQARLNSLETEMARHEEIVNSIASLFSSSDNISRQEFRDFVGGIIQRHPNIQGFSWNPLIKNEELKSYVKKANNDGFKSFKIKEFDDKENMGIAQEYKEKVVVYYIEPYLGNEGALGFNIASHPGRMNAINKARDTGEIVATDRIKLVQKKGESYGYLLLKAVYKKGMIVDTQAKRRKYFVGLAVGVFNLQKWAPFSRKGIEPVGIDIWVTNLSPSNEEQLFYFHSSRTRDMPLEPTMQKRNSAANGLHWKNDVYISGRKLTFLFTPTIKFLEDNRHWFAFTFLFSGFTITFLLLLYILSRAQDEKKLIEHKLMLEETVGVKTKELQLANSELELYRDKLEIRVKEEIEKNEKQSVYLLRQSRLAQMGEMISMIAHQWRQPLASIAAIVNSMMIQQELDMYEKEEFRKQFNEISNITQYLSSTINDFRNFFKESKIKEKIKIRDIVAGCLKILSSSLDSKQIKVHTSFEEDEVIEAHKNELMQVLLNIIKNAEDMFALIKTEDPQIWIRSHIQDKMVCLEVEDNAGGIDEDNMDKIFDPYFSTKEQLGGTGLGLYMSQMIISNHSMGTLDARNSERGAVFEIRLPQTEV